MSGAAGVAPSQSWLSGVFHAIGNFVAGAAKDIYHDITDLPHAIKNVWEHPGSLAAWGELAKDLATTASIVAIAAAPFAAPELLEADAAIDGAADVAGEAAGEAAGDAGGEAVSTAAKGFDRLRTPAARNISSWSGKASTGLGLGQTGTEFGQGDWKGGLTDLAFTALPSAGSFGKAASEIRGDRQPQDARQSAGGRLQRHEGSRRPARQQAGHRRGRRRFGQGGLGGIRQRSPETVKDTGPLRALGLNKAFAERNAFSHGLPDALHGLNIDNASALAAHGQALVAKANQAAAKSLHLGTPVAGAVDKLIAEPIESRIHDKVHPAPAGVGRCSTPCRPTFVARLGTPRTRCSKRGVGMRTTSSRSTDPTGNRSSSRSVRRMAWRWSTPLLSCRRRKAHRHGWGTRSTASSRRSRSLASWSSGPCAATAMRRPSERSWPH